MELSREELADLKRIADAGRKRYEQTQKAKASKKMAETAKRQRDLGIKVIRGGKSPE